ncbi:hypothetical protein M885DRAFT_438997 [Pelagophyceae sp. CCMP2097]|nr:hypothetical protein M885DRAFT_438997 [Pelagophyceae sp. CCMP2097]
MGIYFGSQTGTAEGFAKILADEARAHGFAPRIVDLEDFEPETLCGEGRAEIAIFAMATYGEGEPTDNAHVFLRWCKEQKKEGSSPLAGVRFSVFGLGNKQYEHFNAVGRQADGFLEALGGSRAHELGIGDDDDDLEADFVKWREGFWAATGTEAGAATAQPAELKVVLAGADGAAKAFRTAKALPDASYVSSSKYYGDSTEVTVAVNRELRRGDAGSTRHIELAGAVEYATADNLAVLAVSAAADVSTVAEALGFANLSAEFALAPVDAAKQHWAPFPTPCTVGDALGKYCDLAARPRHAAIVALSAAAPGCPDLAELAGDAAAFAQWRDASNDASSLAATMKWAAPKLDAAKKGTAGLLALFLEHVAPRLQPRYYTISSSNVADGRVHITVAVLNVDPSRRGLCTGYLADAVVGSTVRVFNRASSFRAPKGAAAPLILVGPGTGVAPMRAVLRELDFLRTAPAEAKSEWRGAVSRSVLYFGCKKSGADDIYADEMASWLSNSALGRLEVAFSRDQGHKVYVQDLLARPSDAEDLRAALINERGAVFICGGVAMGNSVAEAIKAVLAAQLGDKGAAAHLDDMKRTGRYVQELWA